LLLKKLIIKININIQFKSKAFAHFCYLCWR